MKKPAPLAPSSAELRDWADQIASMWSHDKFPRGSTGRQGDNFRQFNAQIGCRLAHNRCEVSAHNSLDVTDANYPSLGSTTFTRSHATVQRCSDVRSLSEAFSSYWCHQTFYSEPELNRCRKLVA